MASWCSCASVLSPVTGLHVHNVTHTRLNIVLLVQLSESLWLGLGPPADEDNGRLVMQQIGFTENHHWRIGDGSRRKDER